MSKTIHEVVVEFIGKTDKHDAASASVSKNLKDLGKQATSYVKQQFSQTKKAQVENTKDLKNQKANRKLSTESIRELLKKTKEITKQNVELLKQLKITKSIVDLQKKAAAAISGGRGGGAGGRGGGTGVGAGGRPGTPGFFAGFSDSLGASRVDASRYGLGSMAGSLTKSVGGLLARAFGEAIQAPIAAITSDYENFVQYKTSLGMIAGLTKETGLDVGQLARATGSFPGLALSADLTANPPDERRAPFVGRNRGYTEESFRQMTRNLGEFGYMPTEVAQQALTFARAAGASPATTQYGLSAAKALSLDPGEIANIFESIRGGRGQFGTEGLREFQKVMKAAMKGGVDESTLPEYLEGIRSLTERAAAEEGEAVSALPYAQLMGLFEKSGIAGLKGARGARVASALESMIKTPGGGLEGESVVMASLGFGRPGGNLGYYEARREMQRGFQGEGGASRVKNLMDYVDEITGGGEEANLYLEQLSGGALSLSQIESVREAFKSGKSQEDIQSMLNDMTATELDVLRDIRDQMKSFLGQGKHQADIQQQSIDRGEQYAQAVEDMMKTVNQYFNEMAPALADTLINIAEFLRELTPIMKDIASFLRDLTGGGSQQQTLQELTQQSTQTQKQIGTLVQSQTLTTEQQQQLAENVQALDVQRLQISKQLREEGAGPGAILQEVLARPDQALGATTELGADFLRAMGMEELADLFDSFVGTTSFLGGGAVGEAYDELRGAAGLTTAAEDIAEQNRERERIMAEALTRLGETPTAQRLREQGVIEGRIDTSAELRALREALGSSLRSVGIAENAGDRARVNTTARPAP